jgi:hypothetical protein
VADKITQQITDALTKAAAHPGGLQLYAGKSEAGLFPNTAAAKPAAQKCLADQLVRVICKDTKGKTQRDLYVLTDAGWEFLLAQVNPKQVLEDFVRVLEARQGEVGELLDTARRMADSLQGLKDAVARVLPTMSASRVQITNSRLSDSLPSRTLPVCPEPESIPTAVAVLDSANEVALTQAILTRLADWTGATDCTLPELFRSLSLLEPQPTIGQFHDCLRKLFADGAISLTSWPGPLYAMPEPAYALLVGHGIAYYASLREAVVRRPDVEDQNVPGVETPGYYR